MKPTASQLEHVATLFYGRDAEGGFVRDIVTAENMFLLRRIAGSSTVERRRIFAEELMTNYHVDETTGLPGSVPFLHQDAIRIWHGFFNHSAYSEAPFTLVENRAWSMRFAAALGTFHQFVGYFEAYKHELKVDELEDLVYDMRYWHEHVERVIPQYILLNLTGFLSFYAKCLLPVSTALEGEGPTTHRTADAIHEIRRHHTNTDAWITGARSFFKATEPRLLDDILKERSLLRDGHRVPSDRTIDDPYVWRFYSRALTNNTYEEPDRSEQLGLVLKGLCDGDHATSTHLKWLDFFMEVGLWEEIPGAFFAHHHAIAAAERICARVASVYSYQLAWSQPMCRDVCKIALDTVFKGDHVHVLLKYFWVLTTNLDDPVGEDTFPQYFRLFLDVARLRCADGKFPSKCFAEIVRIVRTHPDQDLNPLKDPMSPLWKELNILVPANDLVAHCLA